MVRLGRAEDADKAHKVNKLMKDEKFPYAVWAVPCGFLRFLSIFDAFDMKFTPALLAFEKVLAILQADLTKAWRNLH